MKNDSSRANGLGLSLKLMCNLHNSFICGRQGDRKNGSNLVLVLKLLNV